MSLNLQGGVAKPNHILFTFYSCLTTLTDFNTDIPLTASTDTWAQWTSVSLPSIFCLSDSCGESKVCKVTPKTTKKKSSKSDGNLQVNARPLRSLTQRARSLADMNAEVCVEREELVETVYLRGTSRQRSPGSSSGFPDTHTLRGIKTAQTTKKLRQLFQKLEK